MRVRGNILIISYRAISNHVTRLEILRNAARPGTIKMPFNAILRTIELRNAAVPRGSLSREQLIRSRRNSKARRHAEHLPFSSTDNAGD